MNDVPHLKTVSDQSADVYKLLQNFGPLTANEIADNLEILPNAVYRVANKMVGIGMIEKQDTYPIKFAAKNPNSAMNWYLLTMAQNFKDDFEVNNKQTSKNSSPTLSFIKNRESLIARELEDLKQAKKTYNYIVSGHEVPDQVFYETRKATLRGVKIRKIVHQKTQTKAKFVKDWQDIGVEVRYLAGVDIRMFVFDSQIVYLTSYSHEHNHKAFGVRFAYAPLAMQMDDLFEQNWQRALKI